MNSIRSLVITIIACLSLQYTCQGDEIITVFLHQYPMTTDSDHGKATANSLKKPGKIAHHEVHGLLEKNVISGIFASYGGYVTSSSNNGQLFFPRKHEKPIIHILITDKITPMMITGNTIHHWEIEAGTAASMYTATRKKDPVADLFYWDVQKAGLPENNRIPLETLIIFAKPKNIYVPTGITPTTDRPNLVLPDIFVKQGIKIYPHTLYVLNIKHFFGPIGSVYKVTPTSYRQLIKP